METNNNSTNPPGNGASAAAPTSSGGSGGSSNGAVALGASNAVLAGAVGLFGMALGAGLLA